MADHDLRNPTTGETAQESVDRMAGSGKQSTDGGAKGPTLTPTAKPPGPSTHPSAPGGRNYGSPIEPTILH
ncbi:MAG TPA: hypothetical protein VMH26_18280 [Burkholderiales bacterium]|nr:hypothetical protein [Burkholderiales bacterium]